MSKNSSSVSKIYYLPNDIPPLKHLFLLGLQHVLTMFPANVLVALLTGFHVNTVLLATGVSTIVALIISKLRIGKFIPVFYGSSFSYIGAYLSISHANFGVPANDDVLTAMQAGILVTGLINIIVGLIISWVGKAFIDKILPPIVTGSVAAVIGFALGYSALDMASNHWGVSMLTLLSTVILTVYLQNRGFIGMLPILIAAVLGYIVSVPLGLVDLSPVNEAALFSSPHITFPNFSTSNSIIAIFSISIMAIATIPESTSRLYQISLYVDRVAVENEREPYELDQHVGFNLVLDGIADFLNGLIGGTAGTNYGENSSLMVVTRNYSGLSVIMAGGITILLSFIGKFSALVSTIPLAVSGGLAIYLFGVIGMQGIALMVERKVDLFDPAQLAIGATILIVGVGGHIGYPGGLLPILVFPNIFPNGLPAIATSALLGIFLNIFFLVIKTSENTK